MQARVGLRRAIACLLLAGTLAAHVRLIHSGNGKLLYWKTPSQISVSIASRGSDDLSDASATSAMRNSIASWNQSTGTSAHLVEDSSPASRARLDWAADDVHMMVFDEDNSSGYFPPGCGLVAITPVWFTSGGRIVDADVLFNGAGFHFTTSAQSGAFDVQDIATHELGHLLGLDHSGCVGASLYPYVSPNVALHRSISSDDEHGLRDAYPSGGLGSIQGSVLRASDQSPVAGALVVARSSAGRTLATALASTNGVFRLRGLAPDAYQVYATPLDFPVSAGNLTVGHVVHTDFQSTQALQVDVAAGASVTGSDLPVGPDASFALGRIWDQLPLGAPIGRSTLLTLHGSGLSLGSTLESGDPLVVVAPLAWLGSQVIFSVTVPADAPVGHVDVVAISPLGERSALVGALEIVPPRPVLDTILPAQAPDSGGTLLTISGRHFRHGLRVVIGEHVYADGLPGGCQVLDANTIQLSSAPSQGGVCDVVVIDDSGVEGRLDDGFVFASVPAIASLFPAAGATLGGTRVTLSGSGFAQGVAVRIDGIAQLNVAVESATRMSFETAPGVPGGPYVVEVENPGGAIATAAFAFAAQADPQFDRLSPTLAPAAGSVWVTLHGDGFTPTSAVRFGVDPHTGAAGASALLAELVDAQTLRVLAPAHAAGVVSVLVEDSASGQAAVLVDGFTYRSDGSAGGCAATVIPGPPRVREVLEGAGWLLAALGVALAAARPRRSGVARA